MSEIGTALEVGERIATARNELGLSQDVLAKRTGITRERLAGYEKGRGRLRCGIVFSLCRNLILSERWVATGGGVKNQYRDVESFFPEDLLREPFLELYDSVIKKIYEKDLDGADSLVALIRYDDIHPDVYKHLCFIEASKYSRSATDKESQHLFWMDLIEKAFYLGEKYSTPPRERLVKLDDEITILKNEQVIPFSYAKLFDDLSLIGLGWFYIEIIAKDLQSEFARCGNPIPIDRVKELIFSDVQELGNDKKMSELYRKLYLKEK